MDTGSHEETTGMKLVKIAESQCFSIEQKVVVETLMLCCSVVIGAFPVSFRHKSAFDINTVVSVFLLLIIHYKTLQTFVCLKNRKKAWDL